MTGLMLLVAAGILRMDAPHAGRGAAVQVTEGRLSASLHFPNGGRHAGVRNSDRVADPARAAQVRPIENEERDLSGPQGRAADAAGLVARTAIQCHGAIGYTTEYDLHLFAKRAWALIPAWGTPQWHRERLAEHLGLEEHLGVAQ